MSQCQASSGQICSGEAVAGKRYCYQHLHNPIQSWESYTVDGTPYEVDLDQSEEAMLAYMVTPVGQEVLTNSATQRYLIVAALERKHDRVLRAGPWWVRPDENFYFLLLMYARLDLTIELQRQGHLVEISNPTLIVNHTDDPATINWIIRYATEPPKLSVTPKLIKLGLIGSAHRLIQRADGRATRPRVWRLLVRYVLWPRLRREQADWLPVILAREVGERKSLIRASLAAALPGALAQYLIDSL